MQGIFGKGRSTANGSEPTTRGVLSALARDTRGNMLAIMCAALIPFAGLVGGGMDLSRMYITKTRLQHACDAGALAGRKMMGGGTWSNNSGAANAAARQYFLANFDGEGMYGSGRPTVAFAENAGKVTGAASATLPMTLMRVLGKTNETLSVTCDADMRLPNTDIMFVLDTTGSMADIPFGDTVPKIDSLKTSVKCFYEIVARLDTDATCTTGTPSGGTGNQVQIRFGFVPYATNVNVGRLLKPEWFANSWNYQTRTPQTVNWNNGTPTVTGTQYNNRDPRSWSAVWTTNGTSSTACDQIAVPANSAFTPTGAEGGQTEVSTTGTYSAPTNTWFWATYQYGWFYEYQRVYNPAIPQCRIERRQVYANLRRQYQRIDTRNNTWLYKQLPVNVGLLKNGSGWNPSFQWGIDTNGANKTINWKGCIEERATVSQASYSPIPAAAKDLDIDTIPTAGDPNSLWGMVLPDLIYTRYNGSGWTRNDVTTPADLGNGSYYACPTESKLLQSWPDADAFDTYVDQLSPEGNTYHDIGLLWGARLMSPTGLFAATNALTSAGGEIDRNMIFMTDGDACTAPDNYTAYGVNWYDRRQTDPSVAPTGGCTTTGTLTAQVNARTEALCAAIKNKNITLWVISFGYVDPTTVTRLTACATTSRYYSASNAATLQSTFASIANQISQLRLTK